MNLSKTDEGYLKGENILPSIPDDRKKSKDYKMQNKFNHNFMVPNTFIKWWFSWALSLKIDFRRPCLVCQFELKQLACEGTKVGIGFRHANLLI